MHLTAEQIAFESMAKNGGYSLNTHPLHYLYTNEKTHALRTGWNSGRAYAQRVEQRAFLFAVSWYDYDERGQKSTQKETEYQLYASTEGRAWFMLGQVFNAPVEYEIHLIAGN